MSPSSSRSSALVVALGLAGALGLACAEPAARAPTADDPCKDVELQIEKVWSPSVRAGVMDFGGGGEPSERKALADKLDALSEDWVRLRLAACHDYYERKAVKQADYERQVKCFDERLDRQRTIVTLMKGADTSGATKLGAELAASPASCK